MPLLTTSKRQAPPPAEEAAPQTTIDSDERQESPPSNERVKLLAGFNAVQFGVTPVESGTLDPNFRGRLYSDVGIQIDNLQFKIGGMNEVGRRYSFGRVVGQAGLENAPVSLAVVLSHGGEGLGSLRQPTPSAALLNVGVGLRLDISKLPGIDFGFVDLVRQTGVGDGMPGNQIAMFWGKNAGPVTVQSLMSKDSKSELYAEVEVFVGALKAPGGELRPFGRVEVPDVERPKAIVTIGFQYQFPTKR